jgi:hypothetical protein
MGLRTGLDYAEKIEFLNLPGLELRPLGCPVRSHSLYLLRYRGFYTNMIASFCYWDTAIC